MVTRKRIVDGRVTEGGAGKPLSRSQAAPGKVPGAVLSEKSAEVLRGELRDIDEAQHAALAAGDQYYLGTRP